MPAQATALGPQVVRENAHYQQQRDKGKAHQAAVRALAFKWLRILFRCWQDHTPYDESVYLQALKRRSAPLLHNLAKGA